MTTTESDIPFDVSPGLEEEKKVPKSKVLPKRKSRNIVTRTWTLQPSQLCFSPKMPLKYKNKCGEDCLPSFNFGDGGSDDGSGYSSWDDDGEMFYVPSDEQNAVVKRLIPRTSKKKLAAIVRETDRLSLPRPKSLSTLVKIPRLKGKTASPIMPAKPLKM